MKKEIKIGKLTINYVVSYRGHVSGTLMDEDLNLVSISTKGLARLIEKHGGDKLLVLDRHGEAPKVVHGRFRGLMF